MSDEQPDKTIVQGVKYLKRAFGLLERLAPAGTERDTAGNRELLFSHYTGLVLLSFFNPTMQSLRGIVDLSHLKKVQRQLGNTSTSTGSLSESPRVFDPDLMVPIIEELIGQVPRNTPRHLAGNLPEELARKLTAVDGSVLSALPQLVAAAGGAPANWRMHLHFHVLKGLPGQITITENGVGGEADERSVLGRTLEPGRTYLLDAGYERYSLFEEIAKARSDYIARVQCRTVEVIETRPLSDKASAAGVVSDEIVKLGQSRARIGRVTHRVRRIVIRGVASPGRKRTDRKQSRDIVLLTNLLHVPAEIIAAAYRLRWSIELFFRFFKHVLGCRKLLSTKAEGVAIQVYCALIVALLMALVTHRSYGRREMGLISLYLQGWASEEELIAGLERIARSKKKRS